MSMDWYAAHLLHLYGAEVDRDYMLMRHEFGVDECDLDVYEVAELVKDGRFDELPDGFPEKAKDVEIISGPEDMVYIGYSVMMPYEKPKYTQEQMDENIRTLLNYLFPKEEVDEMSIHTIFATWVES